MSPILRAWPHRDGSWEHIAALWITLAWACVPFDRFLNARWDQSTRKRGSQPWQFHYEVRVRHLAYDDGTKGELLRSSGDSAESPQD